MQEKLQSNPSIHRIDCPGHWLIAVWVNGLVLTSWISKISFDHSERCSASKINSSLSSSQSLTYIVEVDHYFFCLGWITLHVVCCRQSESRIHLESLSVYCQMIGNLQMQILTLKIWSSFDLLPQVCKQVTGHCKFSSSRWEWSSIQQRKRCSQFPGQTESSRYHAYQWIGQWSLQRTIQSHNELVIDLRLSFKKTNWRKFHKPKRANNPATRRRTTLFFKHTKYPISKSYREAASFCANRRIYTVQRSRSVVSPGSPPVPMQSYVLSSSLKRRAFPNID